MNRPPSVHDYWFARHQRECGGTFHKIRGPDLDKKLQKNKDKSKKSLVQKTLDSNIIYLD